MRSAPHRPAWRRGTAVLEFALMAPVFALVAIGAYDFGNALQTSMRLERAARAGAQFALVQPRDLTGIRAAAIAAWPALSAAEVPLPREQCRCGDIMVTCSAVCRDGLQWTVTVTTTRSITTLILPGMTARRGSATVRVR